MLTYETIKTITIDASEKSRAEEREKEREQCCKDVCGECLEPPSRRFDGQWIHRIDNDKYTYCTAAVIRERAYQEQEGK